MNTFEHIQTFLPGQDEPVNLTAGLPTLERRIYVYVFKQNPPPTLVEIAEELEVRIPDVYEALCELVIKNKIQLALNTGYEITGL